MNMDYLALAMQTMTGFVIGMAIYDLIKSAIKAVIARLKK